MLLGCYKSPVVEKRSKTQWRLLTEPSGTRHSSQIKANRCQTNLCLIASGTLGPHLSSARAPTQSAIPGLDVGSTTSSPGSPSSEKKKTASINPILVSALTEPKACGRRREATGPTRPVCPLGTARARLHLVPQSPRSP